MTMTKHLIDHIDAHEILDCRGEPTLRVSVVVGDFVGQADVPAGKSTGKGEAHELRDGGARYGGRGVQKALQSVSEKIAPRLKGLDVTNQRNIDLTMIELDATVGKKKLGANAIVGVSLAVTRAAAQALGLEVYQYININCQVLPVPLVNL